MKKICSVALLMITIFSLTITDADAQRFSRRRAYSTVGVGLNAMNYFGDIVPEPDFTSLRFKSTRPNINLTYTRKFHPRFSYRVGFAWGRITGNDSLSASLNEAENRPRYIRNLSFRNDIKELSGVFIIDLFENRNHYRRRPDFVPYAFAGIAVFHHNPKGYWKGGSGLASGWYELQPLGTEGQFVDDPAYPDPYKRVQIAIPFGLGVRYKLDKRWDLGFELGWRKTFTDYLDDVSTNYADPQDLRDVAGPAAALFADRKAEAGFAGVKGWGAKGDQRGDSSDKDWYIVAGFNVNYILGNKLKSPKFR